MSRGQAMEGPLGSGTTQGIGHGSSRNRAPRFHGVASASWPCLPTQPQFALHPFWEVDLMTASQRPQQLFSPSTAPSLVLASMSQVWSHCSRGVVGATASLLLSPFTPVLPVTTAASGATGGGGCGCCSSFHLSKDSSAGTQSHSR